MHTCCLQPLRESLHFVVENVHLLRSRVKALHERQNAPVRFVSLADPARVNPGARSGLGQVQQSQRGSCIADQEFPSNQAGFRDVGGRRFWFHTTFDAAAQALEGFPAVRQSVPRIYSVYEESSEYAHRS